VSGIAAYNLSQTGEAGAKRRVRDLDVWRRYWAPDITIRMRGAEKIAPQSTVDDRLESLSHYSESLSYYSENPFQFLESPARLAQSEFPEGLPQPLENTFHFPGNLARLAQSKIPENLSEFAHILLDRAAPA
jgi:hypothetical protein